ncbi:MAG TPA: hypothetical protein ENH06_00295 [bacterium]|nr:hypothetical protein [bacterium]
MKKILFITTFIFLLFFIAYSSSAYVMSSSSYRVQKDSLNIGGVDQTSTNYKSKDSIGEIATGQSSSANYNLKAGYQAEVPPVLIFSVADNTATLGLLATSLVSTDTTTFSASTNAIDGYAVTISGSTLTSNSGLADIDALATPTASSAGTEQFGINLVDNASPNIGANSSGGTGQAASGYNTADNFKFVSGDTIANSSSFTDTTTFTISYIGNISTSTVAGDYETTLTLIASGTF